MKNIKEDMLDILLDTIIIVLFLAPIMYWCYLFYTCQIKHFNTPLYEVPHICKK